MSYVLRHRPDSAHLILDEAGWADLDCLSTAVHSRFGVGRDHILRIVRESPKQRFAVSGSRIRANQGHTIAVDLALKPQTPPETLFHGTATEYVENILSTGLNRGQRHHVHLSLDIDTAVIVARRRRKPWTVLAVAADKLHCQGQSFFLTENGVWLTDAVPPQALSIALTSTHKQKEMLPK